MRNVTDDATNPNKAAPILADKLLLIDTETDPDSLKEVLISNLLKTVNLLTADSSPDVTADFLLSFDVSAADVRKVLLSNLFKSINGLTADASPDVAADFLLSYDTSAGVAKKVLPANLALYNAVTNWVPTFANLTLGSATVNGKYLSIGKLTAFHFSVVCAADTSFTGVVTFNLPTTPQAFTVSVPFGSARYKDATGGAAMQGTLQIQPAGNCQPLVFDASGTYVVAAGVSAAVPFTWAVSDDFECSGVYLSQ